MDTEKYKQLMQKSVKHLEEQFGSFQIGRASTWLVEKINVYIPARDMKQPMSQMANISIMDAQTIRIEPWDKSTVSSIEKWIYDSWIWLTPQNQWEYILIKVPPLTQERREELKKLAYKYWEEAKIAIRNIRQDAMKEIKKLFEDKAIWEDEKDNIESTIDDMTKDLNLKVDNLSKAKADEIMKI